MYTFLSNLKVGDILTPLDISVIIIIILLTFIAVLYGNLHRPKNKNKFLDYMLMGRSLTLPLFVATLAASWYGGIFGVNEITFNYGIYNFVTQGVFWYIAYIIFALFLVGRIKKYKSITMPSAAGQLFGPMSHKTAAVFTFLNILPISYVLSLGIFLQLVFGLPLLTSMVIGTLIVCLYTAWTGFRAVVFSDAIQFVIMCTAVLMVLLFSLRTFGGLAFLKANLPASHFSITGGNSWANTFVWAGIALATLVDPAFYQRCFAAKDIKTAKYGILICTFIWFCFDICTTAGALYARAILPDALPAHSYFLYAVQLLPSGFRGLFVAGILCVILSTLDSFLFIASNTLAYDFLKNKFKNKILANQIFFFIIGALSIFLALCFDGSFKQIWFVLGSYMSACLLVPMMMGYLFPKQISDNLFTCSVLLSATAVTFWNLLPRSGFWVEVEGFYIGLLVSVAIFGYMILRKFYGKN